MENEDKIREVVFSEDSDTEHYNGIIKRETVDGAVVVEFDVPSDGGVWSFIYQEYLSYIDLMSRKRITGKDYHDWLQERFYPPVRK